MDAGTEILALDEGESAWEAVLALEPPPLMVLESDAITRGLAAMGVFSDLVSPYLSRHSSGVAALAGAAAERCRIDADKVTAIGAPRMCTISAAWQSIRGSGRNPGR